MTRSGSWSRLVLPRIGDVQDFFYGIDEGKNG